MERDEKKAVHYFELAAMGEEMKWQGIILAMSEFNAGNMDRALKHFMIAAGSGYMHLWRMLSNRCS